MKILAIDYGTKNIGLALSDDSAKFAFAYGTLKTSGKTKLAEQKIIEDLRNICEVENAGKIVVGLPLGLSSQNTGSTEKVFNFIKELEDQINLPVTTEDERLTTVQASKLGNQSAQNIDELSAQVLLQSYLDKINKQ